MLELRDSQVEELVEEQLRTLTPAGDINHDIYEERLTAIPPVPGFAYVPYCIYFYYVRLDNSGKLRIDHYFDVDGPPDDPTQWQPIPYADVPARLFRLAMNGRPGAVVKNPPTLPDHNFDNIIWTRRSYIAFFFDEANWRFHTRDGGKAALAFKTGAGLTPNHSFFDAKDVELEMPNNFTGGTDKRSALFFVNHKKRNENGDDFPPAPAEEQVFEFEMFLKVQFAEASTNTLTVIFDPTGTNQGPGEEP
jgi:hypothetical protein